ERLLELARPLELLDDVGPADQLSLDEDLRDRRPAGDGGQVLADLRVGKDVDRGDRRPRAPQRLERAVRVSAHRERGRALHEERNVRVVEHVLDLFGVAHAVVLLVWIRSSWMVPSASGASSASYTSLC